MGVLWQELKDATVVGIGHRAERADHRKSFSCAAAAVQGLPAMSIPSAARAAPDSSAAEPGMTSRVGTLPHTESVGTRLQA